MSKVQVEPVQVLVSAPGRTMFCSARGEAVIDSPLMARAPVAIPEPLMADRKAVSELGGEEPQPKLNVSTKVAVLAGIGVRQPPGICASPIAPGVPRQTSQPTEPGGKVGRVMVTV